MNSRAELQAFQMVNNLGYEQAMIRVTNNIEIHSSFVDSLSTIRANKALNYLNLLKSEIVKLDGYEKNE